jgi:hypothetical protein
LIQVPSAKAFDVFSAFPNELLNELGAVSKHNAWEEPIIRACLSGVVRTAIISLAIGAVG